MKAILPITVALLMASLTHAHEGHSHAPTPEKQTEIIRLNSQTPEYQFVVQRQPGDESKPELAKLFDPFIDKVNVRHNQEFLFVESNGMPDHSMMVGITAWQQQVPLPQPYKGSNAWRIPLKPTPAANPISAKTHFFRGAIALAVNGVPIFNPIKNDGKTDTLLAGELDQWGGHCGRADDYHYHIAPVHLEKLVGVGNPVAVALDGYPIYGYNDPNGKPPTDLDWLNGHKGPDGNYHYHATKRYPYLNGGFYGTVVERDGQVDPQPRAQGVRPALTGLRGAKIVGFENRNPGRYIVKYEVNGDPCSVHYTVSDDGSAVFQFVSKRGTRTETYTPRTRGGEGGRGPGRGLSRDAEQDRGERDRAGRGGQDEDRRRGQRGGGQRGGEGGSREGGAGPGGRRGGQARPGDNPTSQNDRAMGGRGGPRGPQEGDGPRQPWILVHSDEIDLDKDFVISRDEIVNEAANAFEGYDVNHDGKLSESELNSRGGSRSAMGGFLKGHAKEIDRDGDGVLTRAEAVGNAERMFDKMDQNGDGKITAREKEASRR
ncbi:YHYH protein [Rhodopirellula sp. SWK7]|uniref:YHYH protein n=1 Tax=Rhodopirellula sp. SWK7 TaxID=595460 RepID=UPI0002BD3E27|nr:YHYH protein [Rhodopirellula sp. SWK7]EMI42442.1 lipoprotein [Rhodopirellula sp. SWK7]